MACVELIIQFKHVCYLSDLEHICIIFVLYSCYIFVHVDLRGTVCAGKSPNNPQTGPLDRQIGLQLG